MSSTPDTLNISLNMSQDTPSMVSTTSGKSKTTQAAADTSSDSDKKHKDRFRKEMSKVIVKTLDPYRKKGVRGHIGNTDDFRHLAKKVTYHKYCFLFLRIQNSPISKNYTQIIN